MANEQDLNRSQAQILSNSIENPENAETTANSSGCLSANVIKIEGKRMNYALPEIKTTTVWISDSNFHSIRNKDTTSIHLPRATFSSAFDMLKNSVTSPAVTKFVIHIGYRSFNQESVHQTIAKLTNRVKIVYPHAKIILTNLYNINQDPMVANFNEAVSKKFPCFFTEIPFDAMDIEENEFGVFSEHTAQIIHDSIIPKNDIVPSHSVSQ